MKRLLLLCFPLCSATPAFCQTSWTYHIGFVLNDKESRPLSADAIKTEGYKIFATHNGIPSSIRSVYYAPELQLFYISGHATEPYLYIGLVRGADTTVVALRSGEERVILTTWPATPGDYTVDLQRYQANDPKSSDIMRMYPAKWGVHDSALYTVTVLDWKKCRRSPTEPTYSRRYFSKYSKQLRPVVR